MNVWIPYGKSSLLKHCTIVVPVFIKHSCSDFNWNDNIIILSVSTINNILHHL